MSESTLLEITGINMSPYSARGLTQSLDPIPAASNLRRTINGALADFSYAQFRKFQSVISSNDQLPPAFNGVWQGQIVIVNCISELSYLTAGGVPDRTAVGGSNRVEGDFTFYRPQLTMRVVGFTVPTDEWNAVVNWQLTLEEI